MLNLSVEPSPQGGQQLNANFAQGDEITWTFAGTINGIPMDLNECSIIMTIGFETPLVLSTDNGGIVFTNPGQGQFQVNIPSDITADFIPGTYPYDVWIKYSLGAENQYITGSISVIQSVTVIP